MLRDYRQFAFNSDLGLPGRMGMCFSDEQASNLQLLPNTWLTGDHDLKWYQCKTVLKGLRAPGGDEVDRAG